MKYVLSFFLCFLFTISSCYGQLSDITLQVDVSNETCLGNGKLVITDNNTTAGAQITCFTYKLPDLGIPVSTSFTPTGLSEGNYKVVVTQTLNGVANSKEKDVVIENKVQKLTYSLSYTVSDCATSTIVVSVLTGNAVAYEITDGPKTFPKQPSNKFPDLDGGKYRVRVINDCGEGVVQDYTVLDISPNLVIADSYTATCDTITLINKVSPNSAYKINYPLDVIYTVFPPNGGKIYTVNKTVSSGPADSLILTLNLPLFGDNVYNYIATVSDNCGRVFKTDKISVNPFPTLTIMTMDAKCGSFLFLSIGKGIPPFTVKFTDSPTGFNPADFNKAGLGPFNQNTIAYGNYNNPVPEGLYTIEIMDVCGRRTTKAITVKSIPLKPNKLGFNDGCYSLFGGMQVFLPSKRKLVSVKITKAPDNYQSELPSDVSSGIDDQGEFLIDNVPIGFYDLILIDECGKEYIVKDLEVPVYTKGELYASIYPSCSEDFGSVTILNPAGKLTSIKITAAPANFDKALPLDVSSNMVEGKLALTDLPVGKYKFSAVDTCGDELSITIPITGYEQNGPGYEVTRNCGSFDVDVNDELPVIELDKIGEGGMQVSFGKPDYWLQKFNPSTLTWEHPNSGVDYPEGSVPNETNSFHLLNDNSFNFTLTGDLRIVKIFQYATAGFPVVINNCIKIFAEFNYTDDLEILGVYKLDCSGAPEASSVLIDIQGVPPYICKITEKDGLPFDVDNGDNNVFSNLSSGTYNFLIQDKCGKLNNGKYTVSTLPKLVAANKPSSMLFCTNASELSYTFDLTQQTPSILGPQNPKKYQVTYHLNSDDAESGANQIASPGLFVNTTNPQTIYVRMINKEIDLCYATTSFEVFIGTTPVLAIVPTSILCEGNSKVLSADPGYNAYEWSTGETSQSINVMEPGTYNVTVKNVYGDFSCDASKDIMVTISGLAHFDDIEIHDWTDNLNSFEVKVSGKGEYEYSLDNVNFQSENVFSNLKTGSYMVYVRDKNGCGTVSKEVLLLHYPKFFTPNDDGFNDRWRIEFSDLEPGLKTFIYDRYGKLLIVFESNYPGWDGTYNGEKMPSTDYWFVVERANQEVHKGHFAMKR